QPVDLPFAHVHCDRMTEGVHVLAAGRDIGAACVLAKEVGDERGGNRLPGTLPAGKEVLCPRASSSFDVLREEPPRRGKERVGMAVAPLQAVHVDGVVPEVEVFNLQEAGLRAPETVVVDHVKQQAVADLRSRNEPKQSANLVDREVLDLALLAGDSLPCS